MSKVALIFYNEARDYYDLIEANEIIFMLGINKNNNNNKLN